jgi:branched-chain amino acid transport system substrate-binding protein
MLKTVSSLLSILLVLASCSSEPDNVKIGVYLSLSGPTDSYGISAKNGFDMALDEVNEAGGLLGKNVRLITIDDSSRSYLAVMAVKKLVENEGVCAILGEVISSRTHAAAPFCQAAEIPMVTPASTHPEITKVGNYIFRTCFIDPFQGEVMASFAYDKLDLRTVASFMDLKNEYSMNLGRIFNDRFAELGGKVVTTEFYSEGDSVFSFQLRKIQNSDPQAVFLPGYFSEVGRIAKQARKIGLDVPFIGTDGWDSPRLLETAGDELEGSYFSNHFSPQIDLPAVRNFVEKYKALYNGETPDAIAVLAYDAARVLFDAIKRAGTDDPRMIRNALADTKDFPGVIGPITIDENRNAIKPAVILKIEDGKFKYQDMISP